jgi:hypothetical protein
MHGDTAWSLIADLTREDVDLYLGDRHARGFNTILVNLIETTFATNAPANAYGQLPFRGQPSEPFAAIVERLPPGPSGTSATPLAIDYGAPDDAYFAHADWVLRRAAERGFLVLLTPSYLGWGGGGQGWYRAMAANGPERLRQYGEYLGRRYRDYTNILWVHAGDYNPPDKDLVRAIAEGIREFDPRALHTAHGSRGTAALDYWEGEAWLKVNNVYTDGPDAAAALAQYARPERMPFFLIESRYEIPNRVDERQLRAQAYQALLSGAAGHVFGNSPIWHFDGPGLEAHRGDWRDALSSRGAVSMSHLASLFFGLDWWDLVPDSEGRLLLASRGSDRPAVAAATYDGRFALAYLPADAPLNIALARLAGPRVRARWYDPSVGRFFEIPGSPFPAAAARTFRPGGANAAGYGDWVLVLESVAAE